MRDVIAFVVLMAVFSIGIAAFKYSTILGVAIWLLAFYLFAKIGSGGTGGDNSFLDNDY